MVHPSDWWWQPTSSSHWFSLLVGAALSVSGSMTIPEPIRTEEFTATNQPLRVARLQSPASQAGRAATPRPRVPRDRCRSLRRPSPPMSLRRAMAAVGIRSLGSIVRNCPPPPPISMCHVHSPGVPLIVTTKPSGSAEIADVPATTMNKREAAIVGPRLGDRVVNARLPQSRTFLIPPGDRATFPLPTQWQSSRDQVPTFASRRRFAGSRRSSASRLGPEVWIRGVS